MIKTQEMQCKLLKQQTLDRMAAAHVAKSEQRERVAKIQADSARKLDALRNQYDNSLRENIRQQKVSSSLLSSACTELPFHLHFTLISVHLCTRISYLQISPTAKSPAQIINQI